MKKLYISFLILVSGIAEAQTSPVTDTTKYKTIAANPQLLQRTKSWQNAWGTNRRAEWSTPVTVPLLWLDDIYGGLKPYQTGGGNETKTLRLRSASGKEYTLRSINKSRNDVIEERFRKTFVEDIINDQLSSSHPYGAFPVTIMQEKAGLYHTNPILVYMPQQPALDSFNQRFGNDLYLLEQRPDGDWSDAANFGNAKNFSSTEKLIEKLLEDNKLIADQSLFIKARLFDMLIADWDRHEDNWRWTVRKANGKTYYFPVARDRDQAFYIHNGWLIDKFLPIGGFSYMQHFDHRYGSMKSFNSPEKDMDRFFANEMDLDDWTNAAKDIQRSLTDEVITESVKGLPPEIFAVSGQELIDKLISRRAQLDSIAASYYRFIAIEVDITGSQQREYFDIKQLDSVTRVSVFRIDNSGEKEEKPYYDRIFKSAETNEIRIYGIGGQDIYNIIGQSPIIVRIIGGPGKDSIIQSGARVHIYDNIDNVFETSSARKHLSKDSAIHSFKYQNFEYDSKGISPILGYDHEDRIYVGLSWSAKKHKWRREPFASRHSFDIKYSIVQHNINASYGFIYPHIIGKKWDVFFNAKYDGAVWRNFPGLGNETVWNELFDSYYQIRGRELGASTGIRRKAGKNEIELSVLFHQQENKADPGRYAATVFGPSDDAKLFDKNNYGGLKWKYSYASVNDPIVPTKGVSFLANGTYLKNFSREQFFQDYSAKLQAWLPLSKKFSICLRAGGSTIVGKDIILKNALFIQHAVIGGPESLRGFRRERFWGKSSFYNNNELRFITNIRTHLLSAKIGLIAFVDDGRVWMPGENSDTWHSSYGGALLLAPFHFTSFSLSYGISEEMKIVQFKINKLF